MSNKALAEEALLARMRAVDELVDNREGAETEITSVAPARFSASILAR